MATLLQQLGDETTVAPDSAQLVFPQAALLGAKAQWSAFWPQIELLMQQMMQGDELSDAQYQQLFYGVLLLADVADVKQSALFWQWIETNDGLGSDLEYILGDALTEDLPTIFYVLSGGDSAPLAALLRSTKAGIYVKAAALAALAAQYESRQAGLSTEALLVLFDETLATAQQCQQAFVLTELAIWCMTFGFAQYAPTFQRLLRQNKLDTELITSREINRWQSAHIEKPLASGLVRPSFDIMQLQEWAAFQPDADIVDDEAATDDAQWASNLSPAQLAALDSEGLLALLRQQVRDSDASEPATPITAGLALKAPAGRNDPCPCGSGKKYKKCCLG